MANQASSVEKPAYHMVLSVLLNHIPSTFQLSFLIWHLPLLIFWHYFLSLS